MRTAMRFLLAAALALGATSALAQQQQQQQQQAPLKPDVTKQYGDWLVRCYPVKSPSPCDMFELLAQKKTGNRVMSVSFAFAPKNGRYVVQIAVPLGVELAKGLVIKAGDYASPAFSFRRCDRGGCYIEGFTDTALLDALGQNGGEAKATIVSMEGKSLDINFSLTGFSDARTAMTDLAKQKATEAPAKAAESAQ